jgi:hypothetical protein
MRRPAPLANKEPDPEPEREARQVQRTPAKGKDKPKAPAKIEGDCPSGYAFGTDVDKHDECAECEIWNECLDARDAAE